MSHECSYLGRRGSDLAHNAIIYNYPGGQQEIIVSTAPDFYEPGWEPSEAWDRPRRLGIEPSPRAHGKKSEGADMMRSMRRARAKVHRIALANGFDWFVTLTLDASRVDRYDPAAIMAKLNPWLDNMVRRKGLRYILVPELHKDGAFHFHGFMSGDGLEVSESGHVDKLGHPVYNLPQWPLGFTRAVRLYGDYAAAVAYCCKYIGKQDGERPMGRWYYSGGALRQPEKVYADLGWFETLENFPDCAVFDLPGKQIAVVHTQIE